MNNVISAIVKKKSKLITRTDNSITKTYGSTNKTNKINIVPIWKIIFLLKNLYTSKNRSIKKTLK